MMDSAQNNVSQNNVPKNNAPQNNVPQSDAFQSNNDSSWLATRWHELLDAYTTQQAASLNAASLNTASLNVTSLNTTPQSTTPQSTTPQNTTPTTQTKKPKGSPRVQRLEISIGQIAAQLSQGKENIFELEIALPILDDATWQRITDTLSRQALFGAQMLAGNLPFEIQDVFDESGASLLPASLMAWSEPPATITARQINLAKKGSTNKDAPQASKTPLHLDDAKQIQSLVAVFTMLGELIADDPWLLLALHGRTQQQILQALRESRGNAEGTTPAITEPLNGRRAPDEKQAAAASASAFYVLDRDKLERDKLEQEKLEQKKLERDALAHNGPELEQADQNEKPRSIDEQGLDDDLERFWGAPKRLKHIHHQIETPEIDLILLRRLGPPPFHNGSIELYEQFEKLYRQVSEQAIALAYTENAEADDA